MYSKLIKSIKQSQSKFKSPDELEQYIRQDCTIADLHVINKYTEQTNIFGRIFISDTALGGDSITRETANRRKKKLHDDGVHFVRKTNHRKPTTVYQHPIFFNRSFRERIKDILPAAAIMPKIALLLAVTINDAITTQIDKVSKVTPFKEAFPLYIKKHSSAYEEEDKQHRKIYKDVIPITNRKPPDIKVDSLNKEQLFSKIRNRQQLIQALEKHVAVSQHWKTLETLQQAKDELITFQEQYDRAN